MLYVTGLQALNLGERSRTPGDWHFGAMDWDHLTLSETDGSPFSLWGIGLAEVPGHGVMPVAGHPRACVDLIGRGLYGDAQGMREAFICDDSYDLPIMRQVWKLRGSEEWPRIDRFMGREYACHCLDFKDSQRARQEA